MKEILLKENEQGLFDGYVFHIDTEEETELFKGLLLKDAVDFARSFMKGKDFHYGINIILRGE